MGPLEIHLNGADSGAGFVIVSDPAWPLPAVLTLRTTDGSAGEVACRTAPGSGAALEISPVTVLVSGTPVEVGLSATTPSQGQNDTAVEVVYGDAILARFDLTAITAPRIRFKGRYQFRPATNFDPFDDPWGTDSSDFRLYAVRGPNAEDPNQPPDEPALDRTIRFHDAVALRPHCAPIEVVVTEVEAEVGGATLGFTTGDPLIGQTVRLGPNCMIEERDGAFAPEGEAPLGDFRLEIGSVFAGASAPAAPGNQDSGAPRANGIIPLAGANPPYLPAYFGYLEPTWAARAAAVIATKQARLAAETPADARAGRIRDRRLREHQIAAGGIAAPMRFMQRYEGKLDRELSFAPNPTGGLAYLATLSAITFAGDFLDFDTDCQCGSVTGTLGAAADALAFPPGAMLPPGAGRNLPRETNDERRSTAIQEGDSNGTAQP